VTAVAGYVATIAHLAVDLKGKAIACVVAGTWIGALAQTAPDGAHTVVTVLQRP
jgi:hypothetical protein